MQKLPISISGFSELRKKNCVYVDKTRHIYALLTDTCRTFLARPRRFGKSLLLSTLEAALQGKKDLFEGLWIAESDYSFEPKGVISLDFSLLTVDSKDGFIRSLIYVLKDIGKRNEVILEENPDLNVVFMNLISALYAKFNFVAILIDEYDYPILHTLHNIDLATDIREIMKSFSCVVKSLKDLVQFVFVTGVSAFSKSGLSSGLNNLDNITMNEKFFDICGYTDNEVDLYFKKHIETWANLRKIPYEEIREQLKVWYNGYCFIENTPTIYSPFSLTCALNINALRNFWFESATPQFLLDELRKAERKEECNLLNLDEMEGNISLLQTFEIECIPLIALLFQMGYLTIKTYNSDTRFYQLKYPNFEVKTALHSHMIAALAKTSLGALNSIMSKLFSSLIDENIEQIIHCLTSVFSNIPYQLHAKEKQPEQFYHAVLQALFIASGIKSQAEYSTSQGRADIIIELPKLFYIIEVKANKSPEEALTQIETQKYYQPLLHWEKPIRALGISFHRRKESKKEKSHFSITYATKKL